MRHNPNNSACDLVAYNGSPEVRCTCDIDDVTEVPAPSVVMPPGFMAGRAASAFNYGAALDTGALTMSTRESSAYAELKAAAADLDRAKQLLKPAEERWRRALDTLHEAMLRP